MGDYDFFPILEILGIVGLIMIVLEAALELKLDRNKLAPISIALAIALVGLLISTWVTAEILCYFVDGFDRGENYLKAWIYATPLSILSSAIIIPSVVDLRADKKEFHIYESTFSDILGIMMFYFLVGQFETSHSESSGNGVSNFIFTTLLTVVISILSSYLLVVIFQKLEGAVKLFLLIAVLLLLYSVEKIYHLSPLLSILIFGLVIANKDLFFAGPLKRWLDKKEADEIYHGLHVITMETAFVVRTYFFVIFGVTISFASLANWAVVGVSLLCLVAIFVIRFGILRVSLGKDIVPQLYIAPRGLITILLFYAIPKEAYVEGFSQGILLFIIIGTSLVMTGSLIFNKQRSTKAIRDAKAMNISETKWRAPEIE